MPIATAFKRKIGDANFVASVHFGGPVRRHVLSSAPVRADAVRPELLGRRRAAGRALPGAGGPLGDGPGSLVLSIHDRPYASLPVVALGIGTLVLRNWLLVPPIGLMGAALCGHHRHHGLVGRPVVDRPAHGAGMDVSILQWFRSRRVGAGARRSSAASAPSRPLQLADAACRRGPRLDAAVIAVGDLGVGLFHHAVVLPEDVLLQQRRLRRSRSGGAARGRPRSRAARR